MNLNLLQCFISLAETLSFTQTARNLGLTQPSVSRQIKNLEQELGLQLFHRDRHQVSLTPEGLAFRKSLTPVIEEFRTVLGSFRERSEKLSGDLSLACFPEIGQYLLFEQMLLFQKKHSMINLQIYYEMEKEILEGLRSGRLDMGVVSRPIVSESMRCYPLIREPSVLVTRTSNSRKLEKCEHPLLIAYDRSDRLLNEFLRKHYRRKSLLKKARLCVVNSHRSMIDFLLARDSYAVMPYFSVKAFIKNKRLRLESRRSIETNFYLVYPDSEILPRRVQAFRKFFLDRCKQIRLDAI